MLSHRDNPAQEVVTLAEHFAPLGARNSDACVVVYRAPCPQGNEYGMTDVRE